MPETFVVREPIFDRNDAVVGYELRFEDAPDGGDPFARAYLSGTFEALRAGKPAYIRCTRQQLLDRVFHTPDPKSIVALLRPELEADDDVVDAVHALTAARIPVALDDYSEHCASAPLLAHAPLVRLDLRRYSQGELRPLVTRLRSVGRRLIASHLPDPATHRLCVDLGFDLFQGTHFSRQEPLPTAELPTSAAGALRLLALARDPDTPEHELENALRTDPALTFQLLRLVNSAAGGGRGVDSIPHALRLVGRNAFARWLALAFAASHAGASGVDKELVQRAVQRARLCELVAGGEGRHKGALFLVGLFSLIDTVLRVPLPEVLSRVTLAPEVCEALLDRTGPLATPLCFVEAYELGLWESAADYALQMEVSRDSVAELYARSVAWAREQLASPQGASLKRAG